MRVSVRFNGKWFVVPCGEGKTSIQWLIKETLRRACDTNDSEKCAKDFEATLAQSGGSLHPNDSIYEVLNDSDFVHIFEIGATGENDHNSPDVILSGKVEKALEHEQFVELDGCSLSTETLVALGNGEFKIKLSKEAENAVNKSRKLLDGIVRENKVAYGVTTGFGMFARVVVPTEKLEELQENLIRSHAAGVGRPLSTKHTRMLFALRINVLAKGHRLVELFITELLRSNVTLLSWQVLKAYGLERLQLQPKEGLALINGTQLITSLGAEAVERARMIARQADIIAAMSLEVLKGTTRAFDVLIQQVRPHVGQRRVAERLRSLLHSSVYPSEIAESHRFCNRVQDAYTLRCCPQVHGIVNDTIDFVQDVITTEMNSATDNPIVFADRGEILSCGNFHGEYPAKVLDYLAIGVHELANMSERRIERLVNPALSELPAFLVKEGGFNSGFMMAHCTAASLVSENKVLCHPSSVDSLSTSAAQEDHVSMGGFSARKALNVVKNVEKVLAIELLAACQGIEFLRPLKTTEPLEAVHSLVRKVVKPWDKDRFMAPDIEAVLKLVKKGKIWEVASPFMTHYQSTTRCQQELPTNIMSPTASTLSVDTPPLKKIKLNKE
ncbi:histidine ammonia-lyase-like [Pocillopora damicornis]|uniref:histidine ammonia-lyase-like n=1 Tax=Pocillopora damicornis TaxID=46731 RepID=UPI000F55593E|nr:histidine ammonia-lyase-like [Pocillopora damicornis]